MRGPLVVVVLVGLGACADDPGASAPTVPNPTASETVNPAPGLEADAMAPAVQASDPTSADAATDRLLAYIGAHAEGSAEADTFWAPEGLPTGADVSTEPFRQSGQRVAGATVDEPSRPEGAAGSVYVTVPATLVVRTEEGATETVRLAYTLRRVNDIPGAEPWSLRWHIDRVEAVRP
ncbi:hypothetical protein [Rubrivirga marina]|uniref:DUF4440 domain-containing protein n=1 Tax=Rubrivirga marina TaxID=1196024 RepID=A0A271J1A1_9BACT|nr:hypothetical protein [Rubrivirga marina]PAP77301.1 hypothetical protein BSZ37_13080 [Rubrivirga marina]